MHRHTSLLFHRVRFAKHAANENVGIKFTQDVLHVHTMFNFDFTCPVFVIKDPYNTDLWKNCHSNALKLVQYIQQSVLHV